MGQPDIIRAETLARRDRLTDQQRHELSERITARLLATDVVQSSGSIFIYVSFRSEVETLALIRRLIQMGKRVAVPLTRVAEKRLDIVVIEDPDRDLVPGYCAIPEPAPAVAAAHTILPEKLDLIILPGSVFDERGGRFGYGGGYYDRLLAMVPTAARYGLAFELQVVKELALQQHDQLVDAIVTEKRVIAVPERLPPFPD